MRNVLIVSPHFPPSSLAGVHRARHLAKYLPAHGWSPIVIRVDERCYTERNDPALASLVPATVEQVRVNAIPAKLTRPLGLGDVGIRAYFALGRAMARTARQHNVKAVLITGSPFYPMLLAGSIRQHLQLPVVLDFQDPWVSAQGATRPRWSKGGLSHQLAVLLEPRAVRHAAFITSVSDTQNSQMAASYPWYNAERMAAIPIGGDPEDFTALRNASAAVSGVALDPRQINLSYVGTYLPRAEPLVRTLFSAVRRVRDNNPELAERLRLNFVGTSNQPDYAGPDLVRPLAIEAGVGDLVNEVPRRIDFLDALRVLARSNGLLLVGSDEPHYTASKIYPALMSARPFISLFHAASSAHSILSAAGGGRTFSFGDAAELTDLTGPLARAIGELCQHPDEFGVADPLIYAPFTAHSVAGRFAAVFEKLAA